MKGKKAGIQSSVVALSAVVVIMVAVAGILGYGYLSTEGQLSSLKTSGRAYCSEVGSAISDVVVTFDNVTESLQAQVQADSSIISSLNASQPSGYQQIVTILNGQITQDLAIVAQVNSYTSISELVNSFCVSVADS